MNEPNYVRDGNRTRCWWCGTHDDYVAYHDDEWGIPIDDDQRLFEKICLEGFQSGLSWLTILRKRDNFRRCFKDFQFEKVARFRDRQITKMLGDAGIVRHRKKIESAINNAKQAVQLRDEHGSLSNFFWSFEPDSHRSPTSRQKVVATSPESMAMAKALKQAGWSFVGPTTCYAFMQSMGMVNDHLTKCESWSRIETARSKFVRPA